MVSPHWQMDGDRLRCCFQDYFVKNDPKHTVKRGAVRRSRAIAAIKLAVPGLDPSFPARTTVNRVEILSCWAGRWPSSAELLA